uniref:Uncharacterized protein n=1 Tax=Rangifer tarandus platyrhynchus TaxID=3082113 RepID=A0ACB0F1E4_RANTA|nr:unnamed protein product [Rangifer tarandus platyrhynchus]
MSVQSLVPRAEEPLSPRATTTEQHPHPRPQLEKAPVLQRAPSPPPHTHAQRGRRGWPSPSAPRNNKGTHSRARLWPRGGAGQARLSAEVTKCTRSRARLCGPVDSGLPSSSDREIFQARILARVSIPYCGGSSQRRECTCTQCVSCPAGVFFTAQAPEKRGAEEERPWINGIWRCAQTRAFHLQNSSMRYIFIPVLQMRTLEFKVTSPMSHGY